MASISRRASFWTAFIATLLSGAIATGASRAEVELWQTVLAQNTAEAYYLYLSLYPAGDYVDEAIAALILLGAIGVPRAIGPVNTTPPKKAGGPYG